VEVQAELFWSNCGPVKSCNLRRPAWRQKRSIRKQSPICLSPPYYRGCVPEESSLRGRDGREAAPATDGLGSGLSDHTATPSAARDQQIVLRKVIQILYAVQLKCSLCIRWQVREERLKMFDLCSGDKARRFWPRNELGLGKPVRHSLDRRLR
jgi:hypothetical protein